jgi:hypothetical protein
MKRRLTMITRNNRLIYSAVCAAALTGLFVGGIASADDVTVQRTTITNENMSRPQLPAGVTAKDLNSDKAIEKSFKSITEDALSTTGFDNLAKMLSDQDYDHVKQSLGKSPFSNVDGNNNKRLKDVVTSFSDAWKTKYNQKFDIDVSRVFGGTSLSIATGEVSDPNALIGNWPVDSSMLSKMTGSAAGGKATAEDIRETQDKAFGGRVNLEKGRNVAVATLHSGTALKDVTASLIHETASGWKFDVPNTLTAQQLYDNLVANLSYLDQHREALPADVNDGYRLVSHAVIAAIYDVNIAKDTGRAAGNSLEKNRLGLNR